MGATYEANSLADAGAENWKLGDCPLSEKDPFSFLIGLFVLMFDLRQNTYNIMMSLLR